MIADYLDRYSRGNSLCHRLTVNAKLAMTVGMILLALLLPAESWPLHGVLLALIFCGQSIAGIPVRYLLQRLAGFLPLVGMFGLTVWLGSHHEHAAIYGLNLVLRSTVCFMAALWLINVVPFAELLATLQHWGVPRFCIALLAFMYRYLFVVFDELQRMRNARRARTFGRVSMVRDWAGRGQLLAMLFIRALNRAERVHGAMCARGWDGQIRPFPPHS